MVREVGLLLQNTRVIVVDMGACRVFGVLFSSSLLLLLLFLFRGDGEFGFEAVEKGGDVGLGHIGVAYKGSHVRVEMEGGKVVDADGFGGVAACDGKLAGGVLDGDAPVLGALLEGKKAAVGEGG